MRLAVALALALLMPLSVASGQDAEAGKALFNRCMACHAVGEGAANKIGPHLNGVVGRVAGTVEDYAYSPAMVAAGAAGLVWTAETLDPYILDPRAHVPGTKMVFPGIKDARQRQDLIAYLTTVSAPAP